MKDFKDSDTIREEHHNDDDEKTFQKKLDEIKAMQFDTSDITLFDDNNWTCFMMANYLKFQNKELEMLYAIFKACSFEDICDEIRDKKDAEKEKIVAARLKERLTQFYETKVQG